MSFPLKQARENFEKNYLLNQLRKYKGNISKTADQVFSISKTASDLNVDVIFGGLGIELLQDISDTIDKTFVTFKELNNLV